MNVEQLRAYCLHLKGVEETLPFDEVTLVFKVMGKMFAIVPLESISPSISLKCDPDWAVELREEYEGINGAWHLNKKHWSSVESELVPAELVQKLIRHSYDLVVAGLTKKLKAELDQLP